MKYITHSPEETLEIAKNLKSDLSPGSVLFLHGDIGVGKTVFTRGVANSDKVCSPTFSIMNIYEGNPPVYHFDLYRLSSEEELYEAGLMEYIESGDGISVIEWPDILDSSPLSDVFDVYITKNLEIDENYREIEVKKRASSGY